MTTKVVLRTAALPVVLDDTQPGLIILKLGDETIASARGPVAGDPDTWNFWVDDHGPHDISGGRDCALAFLTDLRDQAQRNEASLWRPEHGDLDEDGRVAKAPAGVLCVGCGQDLTGDTHTAVATHIYDQQETRHFVCMNCECYLDDE